MIKGSQKLKVNMLCVSFMCDLLGVHLQNYSL